MSGPQWGVGDVLALTKLAWDLYHNCYLVAKDAPEDLRLTVNGLASFQAVLRTLRDDENSGSSFLERLNDDRKKMPERQVAEADHQPPKVGGKALVEQNINICELLRPEDETLDKDRLLAGLDNHAGKEDKIGGKEGSNQITRSPIHVDPINETLSLRFRKSADVTDFENILKLFTPPVLSWSNGPDSGYIYNVFDSEPRKNYEGILVSHTRLKWKYNELFYMYRDTDYVYSRTHAYVQLALIHYT
ncbi:MAG: hypothetical protein Q9177_003463 [Variospora cf. flavescens]